MIWINDRFSFDEVFRLLLLMGFSHESAKNYLINNYSLSAIAFQERIENKSYMNISSNEYISTDLMKLKKEVFNEIFLNNN
jgi:hypothetical protein